MSIRDTVTAHPRFVETLMILAGGAGGFVTGFGLICVLWQVF